jgi:hypothetical protein
MTPTPKEKAKELFVKFYVIELSDGTHLDKEASLECALVAVDEMMEMYATALYAMGVEKHIAESTQSKYLQQVKEELTKQQEQ